MLPVSTLANTHLCEKRDRVRSDDLVPRIMPPSGGLSKDRRRILHDRNSIYKYSVFRYINIYIRVYIYREEKE